MKRRKIFIALAIALPLALVFPLRALRSWQPRTTPFANPNGVFANDLLWRPNGLLLLRGESGDNRLQTIPSWNGSVSLRVLGVHSVALNESGTRAIRLKTAYGKPRECLDLWDMTGAHVLSAASENLQARSLPKFPNSPILAIAMTPEGKRVAWNTLMPDAPFITDKTSMPDEVVIADASIGETLARIKIPRRPFIPQTAQSRIYGLAFSADGNKLALASEDAVFVADATTGKIRVSWPISFASVRHLAFSPDGTKLAFSYGERIGWSQGETLSAVPCLWIYDALSGRQLHSWSLPATTTGGQLGVTNLSWAPDSTRLAWGTFNGKALIMDIQDGTVETRFSPDKTAFPATGSTPDESVYVAFSPDVYSLATATADKITLRRIR